MTPRRDNTRAPGSPDATSLVFANFYAEHRDSIARALSLTLSDRELAIDATNEAMTRAVQRWSTVSNHANPAGWVYRVGLNWARSWMRKRRRERDRPISFTTPTIDLDVPDFALADAVQSLSTDHRSIVICRFYLDWSVDQTAAALDVPAGTVKSRLARALEQLRRQLETTDESGSVPPSKGRS